MTQEITEPSPDYAAIADLYERTAPLLLAYIRSRLASPEEAEDLLIEVFLVALESEGWANVPPDKHLAWLRTVAQHKLIDRYRQQRHTSTMTPEQRADPLSFASWYNPEQKVVQYEELLQLQAAIQRLPPLQRQVLFLHFVEGMRCLDMASLLGKRAGAVRVLLSRALSRLRAIYDEEPQGEKSHDSRRSVSS
jgi:RNA polymerase sigma factor (sigma-70 family)